MGGRRAHHELHTAAEGAVTIYLKWDEWTAPGRRPALCLRPPPPGPGSAIRATPRQGPRHVVGLTNPFDGEATLYASVSQVSGSGLPRLVLPRRRPDPAPVPPPAWPSPPASPVWYRSRGLHPQRRHPPLQLQDTRPWGRGVSPVRSAVSSSGPPWGPGSLAGRRRRHPTWPGPALSVRGFPQRRRRACWPNWSTVQAAGDPGAPGPDTVYGYGTSCSVVPPHAALLTERRRPPRPPAGRRRPGAPPAPTTSHPRGSTTTYPVDHTTGPWDDLAIHDHDDHGASADGAPSGNYGLGVSDDADRRDPRPLARDLSGDSYVFVRRSGPSAARAVRFSVDAAWSRSTAGRGRPRRRHAASFSSALRHVQAGRRPSRARGPAPVRRRPRAGGAPVPSGQPRAQRSGPAVPADRGRQPGRRRPPPPPRAVARRPPFPRLPGARLPGRHVLFFVARPASARRPRVRLLAPPPPPLSLPRPRLLTFLPPPLPPSPFSLFVYSSSSPTPRAAARRRRRRLGQDAGAHPPHRPPDPRPRRLAVRDPRHHLHEQGRRRDEARVAPWSGRWPRRCGCRPSTRPASASCGATPTASATRRQFTIYDQADANRLTGYVPRPRTSTQAVPAPVGARRDLSAAKNDGVDRPRTPRRRR